MPTTVGQWKRAMSAGVAFVALFLAGIFLTFANSPDIKSKDSAATAAEKYLHFLSDSGNRAAIVVSAYLLILAALAFVWFIHALSGGLLRDAFTRRVVNSLAALGAASIVTGAILNATIAGSVAFGDEPLQSGDVIRALMDTFVPFLLLGFGLVCALLTAIFAVHLRRSALVPTWLAYTAWLGVLGGVLGVEFIPFALTLLWFLAIAVVGLVRPPVVDELIGLESPLAPEPART